MYFQQKSNMLEAIKQRRTCVCKKRLTAKVSGFLRHGAQVSERIEKVVPQPMLCKSSQSKRYAARRRITKYSPKQINK